MFSVEDSLKMWVSASNYTNGADYADECFIPFFQGSSLLRECCRNVLFYDLKKFWTQRSHQKLPYHPIYKISCGVKANKKIIQNFMLRKFKTPQVLSDTF